MASAISLKFARNIDEAFVAHFINEFGDRWDAQIKFPRKVGESGATILYVISNNPFFNQGTFGAFLYFI
jgi:hypothetical protein